MSSSDPQLVDRAHRLMTFLARAQTMKTRPVRNLDQYQRDGSVLWWQALPEHEAVMLADEGDGSAVDAEQRTIVSCERVQLPDAPPLPTPLIEWVEGSLDDPRQEPRLRRPTASTSLGADGQASPMIGAPSTGPAAPPPDAEQRFTAWLEEWRTWSRTMDSLQPVKRFYDQLFDMHVLAEGSAETYELCLGVGLLAWHPVDGEPLRRHVFTSPLISTIDDRTGTIELQLDDSTDGLRVELDMLDPGLVSVSSMVHSLEDQARRFEGHPLDEDAVLPLLRSLVNSLRSDARYVPTLEPVAARPTPALAWAPALLLRKRPQTGLVKSFETIADQIQHIGRVPAGLLPLVNPDSPPPAVGDASPGALIRTEMDVLTPLPLNDVQLRILERVDHHAQTLVQGPPGTGKTHTAAALLSHLLAQGKRVLVTAHTDRALVEVRDKLPDQIKPLAVSVIGASRSDMADLKTAVETISRESSERDPADGERVVQQALERIGRLRAEREQELQALRSAREAEVIVHTVHGHEGTLASIARQLANQASSLGWIDEYAPASRECSVPLTDAEALHWLDLLNDAALDAAPVMDDVLLDVSKLPSVADVAHVIADIVSAERDLAACPLPADSPVVTALQPLTDDQRTSVVHCIEQTRQALVEAAVGSVPDIGHAATAALHDDLSTWWTRLERMQQAMAEVDSALAQLPPGSHVSVQMDPGAAHSLAHALLLDKASEHLKTNPDGTPKTGLLTPAIVKQCAPLFSHVRVNGLPPTSRDQLAKLLAWLDAARLLHLLDGSWSVAPRPHPSLHEHAAWHRHLLDQLQRALDTDEAMFSAETTLEELDVPTPDWTVPASLDAYGQALVTIAASERVREARATLRSMRDTISDTVEQHSAVTVGPLLESLDNLDADGYRSSIEALVAQNHVAGRRNECSRLTDRVRAALPALAEAVLGDAANPMWHGRLEHLEDACSWHDTGVWLATQTTSGTDARQGRISRLEEQLRHEVEIMAAARAWNHAVAPDRLTGSARADLTQYSQLVRRLGKGTGKYAARQRAEIRQAMDRCRPAVPVWIMPIYRVAEQLDMVENMFDVVLVDEASQAGLEATLLQYLAPRIVVIGDDKQVSPAAVGLDHEQLHRLADQYLFDDRYKSSWQDPQRSLFDEARMRFGGQLTLVEHRRCVPEIIEFSNQIAYEPDGVRLEPVRQFGSSRLAPFRLTHTPGGQERPNANVNEVEAQALVDALVDAAHDPAYEGRTMGVISLVGNRQAKYIETLLAQRLSAEDWSRLHLRCGDAADFQGSERDVMFLSMVSSRVEGRRLGALTGESAVQRFNVAVSRAKDQVWLFHTITTEQLPNTDDLRHRLLTYATSVIADAPQDAQQLPSFPEDEAVEPLNDVFAQQVFNAVNDRGYLVHPHEVVAGHTTDMVVVGQHSRLIIECEGSTWAGAARYERDLRAQRELERCGWPIMRIRESAFVHDQDATLSPLWQRLETLGILPMDASDASSASVPAAAPTPPGTNVALDGNPTLEAPVLRHDDDMTGEQEEPISPTPDAPGNAEPATGAIVETEADGKDEPDTRARVVDPATMSVAPAPAHAPTAVPPSPAPRVSTAGQPVLGPLSGSAAFQVLRDRLGIVPASTPAEDAASAHAPYDSADADPDEESGDTITAPSGGAHAAPEAAVRNDTTGFHLPPYTSFNGVTTSLTYAERRQVAEGLRAIAAVEGPLTGTRLFRAYARASGASRVGGEMRRNLITATQAAIRSGLLVCDNPLGDAAIVDRTYRLEHQATAQPRLLGPRELEEVPPGEVAAVMNMLLQRHGHLSEEQLFRETLRAFGRQSLTKPAHDRFQRIHLRMLSRERAE